MSKGSFKGIGDELEVDGNRRESARNLKKTYVFLDEPVWKQFKLIAHQKDYRSASALLREVIEKYVDNQ